MDAALIHDQKVYGIRTIIRDPNGFVMGSLSKRIEGVFFFDPYYRNFSHKRRTDFFSFQVTWYINLLKVTVLGPLIQLGALRFFCMIIYIVWDLLLSAGGTFC